MAEDNDNIVSISPKTIKRKHHKQDYTITFIPSSKTWKWSVTLVHTSIYSEEAETQAKADKAAKKFIDNMTDDTATKRTG